MSESELKKVLAKKEIIVMLIIGVAVIIGMATCNTSPSKPTVTKQPPSTPTTAKNVDWLKPVPEKEFKSTCKKVVQQDDGKNIYYKELLKTPNKFLGERIQLPVKILKIEESNGKTWIQGYISNKYDTAVIEFYGVLKIYEGDVIQVWGEGDGTFEGRNGMGAQISVPRVLAKYIKKIRSDD